MSKIDDSGPAFPADSFAAQHAPGMSLRDYLAAKAMYGLLVGYITITDDEPNRHTIAARACFSWKACNSVGHTKVKSRG